MKQTKKEVQLRAALLTAKEFDLNKKRKDDFIVLEEEEKIARQYSTKEEFQAAEKKTHDDMFEYHKNKIMVEMKANQVVKGNYRKRDELLIEHNLVENYGARESRHEYVHDPKNRKMVYVNIDTLQTIPERTAICEKCDRLFLHHELICSRCNALRSTKNAKYYYPYGEKDPNEIDI